jgi:hypothetical protein
MSLTAPLFKDAPEYEERKARAFKAPEVGHRSGGLPFTEMGFLGFNLASSRRRTQRALSKVHTDRFLLYCTISGLSDTTVDVITAHRCYRGYCGVENKQLRSRSRFALWTLGIVLVVARDHVRWDLVSRCVLLK